MNKFFCIFCILLFISKTENVFSNNLIYDVNNIEIEGITNNNLTKKKIIDKAFHKAFLIFTDKVLLRTDAINLYETELEIIKDLVFTYQITEIKKNDNNKTISTFNIRFDPKKINNFLAIRGITYADISNISLTLLPVLIKEKKVFLYRENFFYNNWTKSKDNITDSNDKLISYNLALENIDDLEYINSIKKNISLIDVKTISSFNKNINYALVIIYSEEDKLRAFIKTSIKKKNVDRNISLNFNPKDENKSYKEAITIIKREINQIWKEQNLIDVNTPSFLDFFLEIKNLDDYIKLRSVLDSIDIIENYSVLEMTSEYLKVRLKFNGKISKIKNKIIEREIDIKIIENVWKLKIK